MTTVLNRSNARKSLRASEDDATAVPDSTTTIVDRVEFSAGQDILLKKDGKYYLGTVVEVDPIREQCFVKFGDNTDSWSCFKDLVKLSTPEDVMCVVCKKSAPKSKNEIKVCDKCGRGYHQQCQDGTPGDEFALDYWVCKRCTEPATTIYCRPLSYNPDSLNWDTYHRVNMEQIYCYCGQGGNWDMQMLQCCRCRQWFHEKCLACLHFPVYAADRFYVFACMNCNGGKEFARRLEITWVELVHLMLFNLTVYNNKKYFDLDTVILPYVDDNWHALQLPPKISNVSKPSRREQILLALTKNRNRFKCGREIKKAATIWGLRVRLPPPAPTIQLPVGPALNEDDLKQRWTGNHQLQFIAVPHADVPLTRVAPDIMMGLSYQDEQAPFETESPCATDDYEDKFPQFAGAVKKSASFLKSALKHKKRLLSLTTRNHKILRRQKRKTTKDQPRRMTRLSLDSSTKVKKKVPLTPPTSVSAPPTPPNSGSSSNVHSELSMDYNNDSNSFDLSLKQLNLKKEKRHLEEAHTPCDTSGDETSSKSTLDLIIPPPKDFEGKNNPFRAFPRVEDRKRRKDSITLPLPLTAVIPGKPVARPLKRQLSEKDICIGPNGEVKRRRLRRSRNGCNYTTETASKSAGVVPASPNSDWNQSLESNNLISDCVDYALNGRRLRQRADKQDKEKKPPTPKASPVKTEPDISMDDLKSSVHSYFGAATRIQDGERFTVRAKRFGPTGKLEYLMEWEGVNSSLQP